MRRVIEHRIHRGAGCIPRRYRQRRRGQSLLETALLAPLIFFLFLGLTNIGFFTYAFITAGNAARAAAQYTGNSAFHNNQPVACEVVVREMKTLPNIAALGAGYTCASAPPLQVVVDQNYVEPTTSSAASRVTVTYDTIRLFPLPFMSGQMRINRTAVVRLRD